MGKSTTIDAFFKRKIIEDQKHKESDATPSSILSESLVVEPPKKVQRVELEKIDIASLERDPGKRPPTWSYPLNQQDEIRQAYINWGPYQVKLENYPSSGSKKHVNNGDNCAFLRHVGKSPNSFHRIAVNACNDLMNASQHIGTFIEKQSFEQVEINRLRLQVSIDVVRWLAFQGCAFRGRDESEKSLKRGNFHQLIKLLASYNDKVANVVQENAPSNASYTSPEIQKEILYIFSNKEAIFSTLSQHNLAIHNIRGQGYDGASNMRVFIINIVTASSKRNDELKEAQAIEVATKIANGELETGRGLNQIGTLKRAGDIRWGSHLDSISSLLKMFNATCVVLSNIAADGGSYSQRGDANFALNQLLSFEFVFTSHLMKDIMEITHLLCIALQRKSQDILNAMHLVSSTTKLLKNFRDSGWDDFLVKVKLFCEQHQIDIPDMNAQYIARHGRSRSHHDEISVEHYYRVDIFLATIDYQLQELHSRFNDHAVELLVLSTTLDPRNGFMLFKIDDICKLAEKFYPNDFMEQELVRLRIELQHFEFNIPNHPDFQELSGIHELCQGLVKTRKSVTYPLIDRLIRLVLTLLVSTATTEWDMFVGGTDTTSSLLEWTISELLRNTNAMQKLHKEVRQFLGSKSCIREDDLENLHYLKAVIKEALRLHPPVPLLLPRESSKAVKIMGYDIAAGTQVIINAWAIARDPKLWEAAEEFQPERFLNSSLDFKGQNFEYIPFGSGRRSCPGSAFSMVTAELALANLICNFDFQLAGGARPEDLDMTEAHGIVTPRKVPLLLVASLPN
ncbi:uncharacterized protein LOC113766520 [Coffea eugenioides]|uniref:uncharacterized protein LOC113766520 n=1 Tax=Coffea eugenioides TaxID=49369 RepID=UPI000F607844|nr:uncharacterized protein LOC113766520 [Coffea eugenioides]